MFRWAVVFAVLLLASCSTGSTGEEAVTDVLPDLSWISDQTGNRSGNHPPELSRIGDKEALVGETMAVILQAFDADGDEVTFSAYGDIPVGAKFSKASGEFTWSPMSESGPHLVTFVVSDGEDFDSETVELQAVLEKTSHAPEFVELGDQSVLIGTPFSLRLEATDEDGDPLEFSIKSVIPEGASIESDTGWFHWTAPESLRGETLRVTFEVSDGALTDAMELRFTISDGQTGNHPPTFDAVGPVETTPGSLVEFTVHAQDEDGDPVTVTAASTLPDSAEFNPVSHVFRWTPSLEAAGKSFQVDFSASDGTLKALLSVTIWVRHPAAGCTDDEFEPNNDSESASVLTDGAHSGLSICDTALSPVDVDWFKVTLGAAEQLDVMIEFDHDEGDLELALFASGNLNEPLVYSPGLGDVEALEYLSVAGEQVYVVVFGVGGQEFKVPYVMDVARSQGEPCLPDDFEPNDSPGQASALPLAAVSGTTIPDLTICPGDIDVYQLNLTCGDEFLAGVNFMHADGDLDLRLIHQDSGEVVDQSMGTTDGETVVLGAVQRAGAYLIEVSGYPVESTRNDYTMEILRTPGPSCAGDSLEPNDDTNSATPVGQTSEFDNLTLCCDDDWYRLPEGLGTVSVTLLSDPDDGAHAWFLTNPMGAGASLACSGGTCEGTATLLSSSPLFLVVSGAPGTSYLLSIELDSTGVVESCEGHCGGSSGSCYCDDGCVAYGDCCADACELCGYCDE